MSKPFVLGSRGSALALAQVALVRQALALRHPALAIRVEIITTSGDSRQAPGAGEGSEAGLKGLFTREIQEALLRGSIDAAIHSLKDLPGITPPALGIAAVLPRADASDLLISSHHAGLQALPPGARIGTGSVRRRRQLLGLRPDIEIIGIRGNVPTRLAKLDSLDAIVLARAGIERLGFTLADCRLHCDAGTFHATRLEILPAIGQGAIGIETRREDLVARGLLSAIDHEPTHACIRVERELLRLLDGDCRLPVAAHATLAGAGWLDASAVLFPDDPAAPPARASATGPLSDPEAVGLALFRALGFNSRKKT